VERGWEEPGEETAAEGGFSVCQYPRGEEPGQRFDFWLQGPLASTQEETPAEAGYSAPVARPGGAVRGGRGAADGG